MIDQTALQIEKIALFLGQPWKVSRLSGTDWRHDIIDGTGRELFFRVEKDKFKIMGCFPRDRCKAHHSDYLSIGVSMNRPAQDIAADIKRRLLPHYLERYPVTVQRFKDHKAKEEHIDLITQTVRRVTGGYLSYHGSGARTLHFEEGSAEIWSDCRIDLNLRKMTVDQAIAVMAALQNSQENKD